MMGVSQKLPPIFLAEKIQYDKYQFLERFEMDGDFVERDGLESVNWCQKNFYLKGYNKRE